MVHQNDKGLIASPLSNKRLVGQAVKTPASHAGNAGSIPARVTISFYNEPLWFVIFNFTVGVDDAEGPPVPIPNTEVKLSGAENSAPATGCENREMPTQSRLCLQIFLHSSVGSADVHSNLTLTGRQKRKSSEISEKTYMILHSSVGRAHDC